MSPFLITAALSYLLGSIPFGYILVRLFRGEDVRQAGSGNIGATNVARSSPGLGFATLILDAGKGFVAVLVVAILFKHSLELPLLLSFAALFAVLGHLFPLWLGFHGGKGVATGLGSFILIAPKALLCVVGVFAALVLAFRYVSLGSVVAVAAFPLLVVLLHEYGAPETVLVLALASLLIISKHQANIRRLLSGTEPKFGVRRG